MENLEEADLRDLVAGWSDGTVATAMRVIAAEREARRTARETAENRVWAILLVDILADLSHQDWHLRRVYRDGQGWLFESTRATWQAKTRGLRAARDYLARLGYTTEFVSSYLRVARPIFALARDPRVARLAEIEAAMGQAGLGCVPEVWTGRGFMFRVADREPVLRVRQIVRLEEQLHAQGWETSSALEPGTLHVWKEEIRDDGTLPSE